VSHRFVILPIAAVLALSACAGSDTDEAGTTSPSTTSSDTMSSSSDGGSQTTAANTIVDVAAGAGTFTTLVTAVQAAGLEETLRGPGPFTVFAPSDDAFAKLPAGTLDTLLADPKGDLTSILTYHVVPGKVMAADVAGMNGKTVTTVNGAAFTVNVSGDAVTLTDAAGNTATVTKTDIAADNGVIHVIDTVLMPK
jgi:uncharacterized surface protein with fasciclin (FAS1) repeats